MKTLRNLTSVLVLTLMLGLPAFAGELQTPPCAPPVPGELQTPPCQAAAPGDMGSATSTETAAPATFTEIATEVMESMLSIF
jgi:hypothetical protein